MGDATEPSAVKGPRSYFPSIEQKYGRPVEEWQAVIRAVPGYGADTRHLDLVKVLKEEHGLGHGHANALVAETLREDKG